MIDKKLNAIKVDSFNDGYFYLHNELFTNAPTVQSRNGVTKEFLNFKTIIQSPIKRCVGGYYRDINIFFLMAESFWIWAGRRDAAFLEIFNSKIKDYSDDGKYFHAPYGWRLRNYGVSSMDNFDDSNKHSSQGIDQIKLALQMLSENDEDRRVVCAIWNPELDLAFKSKDLPCNDLLMFKIRQGKLFQTIQNRSNDLNWGLTTNVYQFSVIGEIMARILDIDLGDQVHNSQSLHLYLELTPLTNTLQKIISETEMETLYDVANSFRMDFNNISELTVEEKLKKIDYFINGILTSVSKRYGGEYSTPKYIETEDDLLFENDLSSFSRYLYVVHKLLCIYVDYKKDFIGGFNSIEAICKLGVECNCINSDIVILSLNFFMRRMKRKVTICKDVEIKLKLETTIMDLEMQFEIIGIKEPKLIGQL